MESNPPPSLSEGVVYQLLSVVCGTSGNFKDDTVTNGTVTELEEDKEDGFQANNRYFVGTICFHDDLQINRSLKKSIAEKIFDASKH